MKKCPDGKILNPATNRCVKKDGKIGNKLLAQAGKKPASKKPASKKPAPKKSASKKPASKKPASKKPVCSKLKKTKDPKCEDVEGCEWIVKAGCRKRLVHHEESKSNSKSIQINHRQNMSCSAFIQDDHASYTDQLKTHGFVVLPCLDVEVLSKIRDQFDDTVASFPEYKKGANRFVMGGFSAFGNPASFHNPFVRRVRQWCMYATVQHLWSEYVGKSKKKRLEQCIDRMMLRPRGASPSAESWHRDEARQTDYDDDETFGGWINFDDQSQYFNCVPKSHVTQNKHHGFAAIKDAKEKAEHRRNCRSVEVPPGHIIVFFEHIVHEVRGTKATYDMYRLFVGWRITKDREPLEPQSKRALKHSLETQAVMPLKSGQIPPMYARLHWVNWRSKLVEFTSKNILDRCTERKKVINGKDKGAWYQVVPRFMKSLYEYNLPTYPAYNDHEIKMHIPGRKWTVLRPGSTRLRVKISL
jgi:hypothetical protein